MEEKLYMVIAADTLVDSDLPEEENFFIGDVSILGVFKTEEEAWRLVEDVTGVLDISKNHMRELDENDTFLLLEGTPEKSEPTVRFSIYSGEEESRLYSGGYRGSFIRVLKLSMGALNPRIFL